jgi:hypothetical protein
MSRAEGAPIMEPLMLIITQAARYGIGVFAGLMATLELPTTSPSTGP